MLLSGIFLLFLSGVVIGDHFGYSSELQKEWIKKSAACEGKNQSPISISTVNAVPLAIPALEMVGYHNLLPRPISISNNGHSVELKPYRVPILENTAQIFGGLLPNKYHLETFHFHWGRKNNRGSEHVIDSVRFPMEMHIIHRNEKYDTMGEALQHPDGLVVLAFFLQTREKDNGALRPILNELQFLVKEGSGVYMSETFPLASLLPRSLDYFYTYQGSLTTPPCSEAVTWVVFPDPLPVSFTQMAQFRTLTTGGSHHLLDNYRRLQPLNSRKIYAKRVVADASYFQNSVLNVSDPAFWH
ncbi:carbonic anhydrase 2-like [Homalodisca vitripennis]|uniref:carbonic anhydrase 2-like n=1 Tax=Homalodisca vitripennis TaxID=197043 RepID=UPI001EEC44A6|nr:carbonic anhydrase 2-like [Homalodisca vitripennis]XP_046683897.1 carbonic anhydrase 2-like [Homalodisca vitripennis]XP_046683898.1 carbonic anhydrase 2-like [Homalodisca vitripennis]XP_046683899.1 carbonic anhydrase 2-like [Homalodisca vitripennis]